ncbi:Uncharacterised protein [Candidatus Norongarragalina meridionalis]|nr:Uncharacterised protein [Candidatus Norongarragalina meridionalis]
MAKRKPGGGSTPLFESPIKPRGVRISEKEVRAISEFFPLHEPRRYGGDLHTHVGVLLDYFEPEVVEKIGATLHSRVLTGEEIKHDDFFKLLNLSTPENATAGEAEAAKSLRWLLKHAGWMKGKYTQYFDAYHKLASRDVVERLRRGMPMPGDNVPALGAFLEGHFAMNGFKGPAAKFFAKNPLLFFFLSRTPIETVKLADDNIARHDFTGKLGNVITAGKIARVFRIYDAVQSHLR